MSAKQRPAFGRSLKPFKRPWLWSVLWILAIAVVVFASLVPASDLPSVPVSDKVEHFLAYALLSASAVQLFSVTPARISRAFVIVSASSR